jgi:prepilin-type N-terminal cleavage/methylation domain-containing protein
MAALKIFAVPQRLTFGSGMTPAARALARTETWGRFARGFTLTEMAVVLVIVALLIAGMMIPLSAQQDIRARQETEKTLADIREALLGYAASHAASDGKPYLPCPDTDDDGRENRAATPGACTSPEGRIPWVDLGLGRNDAWNNRFRYRVTAAFSNSAAGFTLATSGDITVCADSANCATTKVASAVPAVVLSHGPNGLGAFNMAGGTNPAPTAADEQENTDGDTDFVSRISDGGFDDLVTWVPTTVLMNRMLTSGKLP